MPSPITVLSKSVKHKADTVRNAENKPRSTFEVDDMRMHRKIDPAVISFYSFVEPSIDPLRLMDKILHDLKDPKPMGIMVYSL